MEIKKSNIPNNTITRKLTDLDAPTGNIYESVVVISKRANQISSEIKQELNRKLADFSSVNDSLEETFENREPVSYTHLDVYKRQNLSRAALVLKKQED